MLQTTRLDSLLVERGLAQSREQAKALIMSSNVYVDGQKSLKPGTSVSNNADIEVKNPLPYVSRGGLKLEKALDIFNISAADKICLDCGASTGGFTDCLLQNGAKLVYAVDVGYGQLAWKLRNDPRVVVMERTNIRNVTTEMLAPTPELAVIDLSFISLALVLPVLKNILTEDGQAICLIKPQFEAGREKVGKKGVVRDPETHKEVVRTFMEQASKVGFRLNKLTYSPLKGPQGNIEFFGFLDQVDSDNIVSIDDLVNTAHEELSEK